MYLVKLVPKEISGPWQLLGICDDSGRSVRDFLCTLPPNLKKISFRSIFAVATEKGPFFLSKELCHYINKEEKIYEFIKGRIRIVFFTDGADKIIICTHGFVKTSQKTDPSEVEKAIRARGKYFAAKESGALTVQEV